MLDRLRDWDRLLDFLSFFSTSEEEMELVSGLSFLRVSLAFVSADSRGGAEVSFLSLDLERVGSDAPMVAAPTPSLSSAALATVHPRRNIKHQ